MEKIAQTVGSLFNAVFRPSRFVVAPDAVTQTSVWGSVDRTKSLLVVFLTNVVLYATPLTLSGYGVAVESEAPAWFGPVAGTVLGNPDTVWWLFAGIAQNSAFLIALSGVTLLTYHLALVLTRSSNGFVLTLHTVVYSVSAYLAGIFTVLVFLSRNGAYSTARTLVANLQIRFIAVFYDLFEVPPSERVFTVSESVAAGQLTGGEAGVIAVLITLVLYFGYSMYLGARLNHGTGVTGAVLAVLAVGLSPAIYVTLLLVYSTGGLSI